MIFGPMSRGLLICAVLAMIAGTGTLVVPSTAHAEDASMTDDALIKRSKQVLEWLRKGDAKPVVAGFDDTVRAALPEAQVKTLWLTIEGQAGDFIQVASTRVDKKGETTVVILTCLFKNMPLDLIMAYNAKGQMSGLRMMPTTDESVFGPRPQTPKPPFPYLSKDVTYPNPTDSSTLAGTLTLPKGTGPFPAVVLITGSGAQDRNESIFGHKPFWVIADALTRRGIAVLRVDDRGKGQTTGSVINATVQVHATDVEAGLAYLKTQQEIDPKRMGLIGHSEGGTIAPIVAARNKDVAFFVSLAGTTLPGTEIITLQSAAMARHEKISEEGVKHIAEEQRKLLTLVAQEAPAEKIEAALIASMTASQQYMPKDEQLSPDMIQAQAKATLPTLSNAWMLSFLKLDPRDHWRKVRCPALVMIGALDFQVPAKENFAALRPVLKEIGAKNVRLEELPRLNHLFQPAVTGMLDEYVTIETTFDPAALKMMGDWIVAQTSTK